MERPAVCFGGFGLHSSCRTTIPWSVLAPMVISRRPLHRHPRHPRLPGVPAQAMQHVIASPDLTGRMGNASGRLAVGDLVSTPSFGSCLARWAWRKKAKVQAFETRPAPLHPAPADLHHRRRIGCR